MSTQCHNVNKVKAKFYISSEKLDFAAVDRLMGVKATKIMLKENIRVPEYASDLWILSTDYEISTNINFQLEKLCDMLPSKEVIKRVCQQFDAECSFCIVVERSEDDILPGVYYEREFVEFAAYIGAEIDMDFI